MSKAKLKLTKNKVTKNEAVRFGDSMEPISHNIYLSKEEDAKMGSPEAIMVEISAA
tara:strand:- start:5682 stop:5849 length:168 start_codon:yes stop_codon:yes gene_type:complete